MVVKQSSPFTISHTSAVIREFYCAAHCLNKGNLICNSCRVSLCLVDRANKKSPNKNTETTVRGGFPESPVLNGEFPDEDLLHLKRVDTCMNKIDLLRFDKTYKKKKKKIKKRCC